MYVNWKDYDNFFNSWIDKKYKAKMSKFFPETKYFGERVKVELDLSSYGTRADLKNVTGVDTSKFSKRLILLF